MVRAACEWDRTEIVLKASVVPRDQPFAAEWVSAYLAAMRCFPRLHVLADNASQVSLHFLRVPNVTVHELAYPKGMRSAGIGQHARADKIHGLPAAHFAIQWPFLWVDNFTSAEHVLVFDTDSVPMLPLRCHHLFDEGERPVWHTRGVLASRGVRETGLIDRGASA